jgi:hypothetical protein
VLAFGDAFLTRIDAVLVFFVSHGRSLMWLSLSAGRNACGLMGHGCWTEP